MSVHSRWQRAFNRRYRRLIERLAEERFDTHKGRAITVTSKHPLPVATMLEMGSDDLRNGFCAGAKWMRERAAATVHYGGRITGWRELEKQIRALTLMPDKPKEQP